MNYCPGLRKIIIALTGDYQVWRKVAKIRLRRFQAWRRGEIIRDSEYDSCCRYMCFSLEILYSQPNPISQ